MAEKEGTRMDAQFIVMSVCPDICKSPLAPVPYPIVGLLDKSTLFSPNVRFCGKPVFHMGSRVVTVVGDEAGVGGGVASKVIRGFCKPIVPVTTVRINKNFANHNDLCYMLMNGASQEGPFNTIGQVLFLGSMLFANVGTAGTVAPETNPPLQAESLAEGGCVPDIGGTIGRDLGGLGDIIGMAKQAYGLATTDWSNPGAVLGAIGNLAGMAGLGSVAQLSQFAQQGYDLATADWSNPGTAMGAVMGVAGPLLGSVWNDGQSNNCRNDTPAEYPPGIVANSGCWS